MGGLSSRLLDGRQLLIVLATMSNLILELGLGSTGFCRLGLSADGGTEVGGERQTDGDPSGAFLFTWSVQSVLS